MDPGIEMGDHFYTFALPRMKRVIAAHTSDASSNDGGFFKCYELEQYEDVLRNIKYEDSEPFFKYGEDPLDQYVFLKDLKLLETMEVDYSNSRIRVDFSKLCDDIDIAETLSILLGSRIKSIKGDEVELQMGRTINIKNLDYKLIKPLIWWGKSS